jgi:putative FmdB family regulatory protein
MARYDFQCEKCDIVKELVQSVDAVLPKTIKCPSCDGDMEFVQPLVALGISSMDTTPLDVAVGRSADARWERIHERQAVRDKVRQETGVTGLTATGVNEYQPLSPAKKFDRTDAMKTVQKDGFKPAYDGGDEKLVKGK